MLSLLFTLLACPTEVPEAGEAPGTPGAPPPGDAAAGSTPGAPAPGGAAEQLKVEPGTGVKLSGTASYDGVVEGAVRMDVLKQSTTMPELVYSTTLEKLGAFEVELPKNFGSVQVTIFVDTSGDGPTVGEPMAASPFIEIGETAPAALTLTLAKLENGGGGPPPPAGGAPGTAPLGTAPADGGPPPAGAPVDGAPAPGAPPPAGTAPAAAGTPPVAPG